MERGAGMSMPRAVVITLTFTAAGVPGVTLTVAGTLHVAPCGAPVQVSDTVCVAPVAVSWSAKLAACPAVTVALVDPPCGGAAEKPSPVPLKLTVCGELAALSVMVMDAVRAPAAVGLNATLIVQFAPAATVPHVLVSTKSPPFVPVTATEVTKSATLPLFVSVTVCGVPLVVPTGWLANVIDAGDNVAAGAPPTAVPVRLTDCGELPALSVMVMNAARVPFVVGLNVTLMVQPAPTAMVAPQLLVCEKSPPFAPVTAMLVLVSEAFPLLVSVTVCAALDVPTP